MTDAPPPGDEDDVTLYQPRALRVGEVIGHYRIEAPLGQGGNGSAYAARNIDDEDERVVIKLIRPDRRDRARLARLLRAEAAALRRVKHDAIVQYRTFKRIPGSDEYYLVTEHVDGPPLSACLRDGGAMRPSDIARLAVRVADALECAHEQGVIHRDLSPENIILPDRDPARATLIDFGIAKHGTVDPLGLDFVGKLAYAAPEQFEGDPDRIGPWTDLYSLGLVLAGAARGRRLDMGRDMDSAIAARRTTPDLGGIPESLREPIAALLVTDPELRVRRAADAAALFGGDDTMVAPRTGLPGYVPPPAPAPKPSWVRALLLGAAGIVTVGILAILAEMLGLFGPPPQPAPQPQVADAPPSPEPEPRTNVVAAEVAEIARFAADSAHRARTAAQRAELAAAIGAELDVRSQNIAIVAAGAASEGATAVRAACTTPAATMKCITRPDGSFEGGEQECLGRNCIWQGYVVLTAPDGSRFEGHMETGLKKLGREIYVDGVIYEGEFAGNAPGGLGRRTLPDGQVFFGQFKGGMWTGLGGILYTGGDTRVSYMGEGKRDLMDGYGVMRRNDGTSTAGSYVNNELTGFAVETGPAWRLEGAFDTWYPIAAITHYRDGTRYEGAYGIMPVVNDRRSVRFGLGVLFAADGMIEAQGRWENDRLVQALK